VQPRRRPEPEGGDGRSKLGQVRGRRDRVSAGCGDRLDQTRVADDGVLLADRRHQPDDHLRVGFHAAQQVSDNGGDRHPQGRRGAGAGQERGRPEQHEPADAFGAREGVPERPGPTHRAAGERERVQPQLVDNLVLELDRGISEALARNANGFAQPESRPIHGNGPHTREMLEDSKERQRRRAAAVQEHDRRALARLDDMDPST
jgi:hypothetical protein